MKRILPAALAAALLAVSVGSNPSRPNTPHTYEDYSRQLEDAAEDRAFIYITSERCGPCRAFEKGLSRAEIPRDWTVIPLRLNAYGEGDEDSQREERDAALEAIRDGFGIYLEHEGIPKYMVAKGGKPLGWGLGFSAKEKAIAFSVEPVSEGETRLSYGAVAGCLASASGGGEYSRQYFSLDEARSCVDRAIEHIAERRNQGTETNHMVIRKDYLGGCIEQAAKDGAIQGVNVLGCVINSSIGGSPVRLQSVFDDPEQAVRCSRMPVRDPSFEKECGDIAINEI